MDVLGLALLVWAIGSLLFLIVVEGLCAYLGVPTISERVRNLGRSASIVVIWSTFVVGYLLAHFFDNFLR